MICGFDDSPGPNVFCLAFTIISKSPPVVVWEGNATKSLHSV